MKKLGLLKAMRLTKCYPALDAQARAKITAERLQALVKYAKENSPYYAALYKDVPEDFALAQLPPTNKREMMAHFEDFVTDRGVRMDDVRAFLADTNNIGELFRGEYMVYTTSGSAGEPSVVLCDKNAYSVMSAVNAVRTIARPQDMKALMKTGFKTAGVFASGGFYLSNCSVARQLKMMPWKKGKLCAMSILDPMEEIVAKLNRFRPAMLGGYPTGLELLADEAEAGRLHIAPKLIMTGGEFLSDAMRERLSRVFGCHTQTSYACTEGGTIACECGKQHFHINEDWVIVEPVNAQGDPVPDGVLSDKLYLTNLYNYGQPMIRFEITDRVILHHEPCGCGNPFAWLEIEGRTDEILTFDTPKGEKRIQPLALYAILKEIHQIRRFQLVMGKGNKLSLRMVCAPEENREETFGIARERVGAYLAQNGINEVEWRLSDREPEREKGSGKFKHVLWEK